MSEATPLGELMVGDRFWLSKGREMVEAAVAKREAAAERLATALAWFATVYSAAAVVGAAMTGGPPPAVGLALALPTVLLVAAYATAVSVVVPVGTAFDPRVPVQIEQAFWFAAARKTKRLRWAHGLMLLAAVCVGAGILGAVLAPARPTGTSFSARAIGGSAGAELVVTAAVPRGATAVITADPDADPESRFPTVRRLVVVPSSGRLDTTLEVPTANRYLVSVSWSQNDLTTTVERQVILS